MKAGAAIEPFTGVILSRLLPILNEPRYEPKLLDNSAIALGRVCAQCPAAMAPHMSLKDAHGAEKGFLEPLCCALRNIDKDHSEKADAFFGLIAVLNTNPEAAGPSSATSAKRWPRGSRRTCSATPSCTLLSRRCSRASKLRSARRGTRSCCPRCTRSSPKRSLACSSRCNVGFAVVACRAAELKSLLH